MQFFDEPFSYPSEEDKSFNLEQQVENYYEYYLTHPNLNYRGINKKSGHPPIHHKVSPSHTNLDNYDFGHQPSQPHSRHFGKPDYGLSGHSGPDYGLSGHRHRSPSGGLNYRALDSFVHAFPDAARNATLFCTRIGEYPTPTIDVFLSCTGLLNRR